VAWLIACGWRLRPAGHRPSHAPDRLAVLIASLPPAAPPSRAARAAWLRRTMAAAERPPPRLLDITV